MVVTPNRLSCVGQQDLQIELVAKLVCVCMYVHVCACIMAELAQVGTDVCTSSALQCVSRTRRW